MQKLFTYLFVLNALPLLFSCEKPEEDLKPVIMGINPEKAPKGDFIAVTGRNFSENSNEVLVKFNGTKAEFIRKATLDSIVVQIPYNATTGKVEVVVRGVITTSSTDFIVADSTNIQMDFPAPVITAITPGSASIGDEVIISGSNFLGSQQQQDGSQVGYALRAIKFNGIGAPIVAHSDTRIVTRVPSGATTGKVTVTTSGSVFNMTTPEQTATSATDFIVEAGGTWTTKANPFPGGQRWHPVAFSIGNKGYYGLGYSRDSARSIRDFWEYDPNSDQWTRKANFPGAEREGATGFAIANKGYIAGATDLWEYDPAIDQWTRKADFPGTSRTFAACFSVGSKGYVGTGYSSGAPNLPLDFWEYDAATNRWTQKADFPGPGRFKAVGFSILGKGYIGTGGIDPNANLSTTYNDFWEYDPATNQWNRKADLPGGNREGAIAWSIGTYGYVGAGFKFQPGGGNYKDYWQFNPAANKWNRTSDGEYASSVGTFAIGNSGYYVEFKNEGYPPKVYQFTVR